LVRAAAYFVIGNMTIEQATATMGTHGFVERFYLLVGNAFNYASVLFCWLIFKKKAYKAKFCALWLGLWASAIYFFSATWDLWSPIVNGAQMSDSFAMGFVKITLYTNIVGFLCCLLGLQLGNYLTDKQ
jgi:hypothetical protein